MTKLKQQLIRLGYERPDLRDDIRPVLQRIDAKHPRQSRRASMGKRSYRNLFKKLVDHRELGALMRETDDQTVKASLREIMKHFTERFSLEGSEERAFNQLKNLVDGGAQGPDHLRNQVMKIANLLEMDLGGLKYMSSQRKTAGLSKRDLVDFDLADLDEDEMQSLIGKLNAVSNARGAVEAFRRVVKADPGLFDIDVDQFDTTTNQVVSINAGDVYATTLVFDEGVGSVEVMTFGDAVEAYQRAYYKHNFMDGIEAAEVMIEMSLPLDAEKMDKQIEKLETMFNSEMSHGQMKIEFGPEHVEYNDDFDSLVLGGWMVSDSGHVHDFIQNVGADTGNVSAFNRGIQDILEEDLERFLRETLRNHGFNPGEVLHIVVSDIDEPEKVDAPDYYHI